MNPDSPPTKPEPLPPSRWDFPHASAVDDHGVVCVGGDLEPATIIGAYRRGLFPMPIADHRGNDHLGWWSPRIRGVLPLDELVVSRSLRRSCRRYQVTINSAFDAVIEACASIEREGGWISPEICDAYKELHRLGWAHSVETWDNGELVGGLYGLQIGGLFAGESMFHTATDASKVALVTLVNSLVERRAVLLDVQWETRHLVTLGVRGITQSDYLEHLHTALECRAGSLAEPAKRPAQ